jgi:hypothetical protein
MHSAAVRLASLPLEEAQSSDQGDQAGLHPPDICSPSCCMASYLVQSFNR